MICVTDKWMDRRPGKNNLSPNPEGRDIIMNKPTNFDQILSINSQDIENRILASIKGHNSVANFKTRGPLVL